MHTDLTYLKDCASTLPSSRAAKSAAAVIFAHNHPSADLKIHEQLTDAAKILGIRVLDHIIVTRKGHYSFQAAGLNKV